MNRAQLTLSLSYAGLNEKEFSWRRRKESKDILDRQQILTHVCRFYTNARKPNGIPLIGYLQVSNCGTHKSYIYPKKLCCYYHVIPIFNPPRVIRYGYLCWWDEIVTKKIIKVYRFYFYFYDRWYLNLFSDQTSKLLSA